ncbi:MAG: restriction endonuclease [Arcobacteraceae bacterium]|jgi:type II restriction enzyme|nr:restriction endonuclease [Arcobacteraceae bacterium]
MLSLNMLLSNQYNSNSQKARVLTESWVFDNIFCPICGTNIINYQNNKPVADFYCEKCKEDYELKSKSGKKLGKTIADGAYHTMIERISSETNPNFFFLNYDKSSYEVINFLTVPSYLFMPEMIIPRTKGIPNRPNYIMCNIDISSIPNTGKIFYIQDKVIQSKSKVLDDWNKTSFLKTSTNLQAKGWLLDIIKCIERINKKHFNLQDMYIFENILKIKYPNNNNIQAKIRQQLQILRDKGYLKFNEKGNYEVI